MESFDTFNGNAESFLPDSPALIHVPTASLAPDVKRKGRPVKVAPPAMSMILPALTGRRASAGHSHRMPLRLVIESDTAEGFSVVMGNWCCSVAIDYRGPSDRAFPQLLAAHKGTARQSDPDGILSATSLTGGAYSAAPIVSALEWLSLAMSKDDTRENLCGINFDGTEWTATDGHRLHTVAGMPSLFSSARTLPSWAIETLLRAIKWTKADAVTVSESPTRPDAMFTVAGAAGSITIHTLAVDSQFPDWRQVVPDGDGWSVLESDAAALRAAFKVSPIILDSGRFATAKKRRLFFNGNGTVDAVSTDGHCTALPLRGYVKEQCQLYFAAPYLDDVLTDIDGAVIVKVDGDLSPMLFRHGNRSAVVMPMSG